jgi:sugar (pentulose or hexulose) kinase
MNKDIYISGIDLSTTSVKVSVFSLTGKEIVTARKPIQLYSPEPDYYEQNASDWWTSSATALKEITTSIKPKKIKAVSISNQRETFVPLGKTFKSIRPAIIWLDERCKDIVDDFADKIGRDKIHRITGKPVDYAPVVYRLAWMQKYEKNLFNKTYMICDVHTFLVWKLTGKFRTSAASADPLGLLDMRNICWSKDILSALNLNKTQLPGVYPPGTVLGKVTEEACKITGLSEDTLVVAGSGDGQAAGLGVNALIPDRAYLNLGTAVVCGVFGKNYITDMAFRTLNSCSENGYYYECSLRAGTFAIDWFIKNISGIEPSPDIYKKFEKDAEKCMPGSRGLLFLPYICGAMNPYWDKNARGAFIGLSSSHTKAEMYRAVLEGIAFEILFELETVEDSIGIKVKELALIGGGTVSSMWCRIIADITGKDILILKNNEASCLGAGIAASVGAGLYSTFREAASKMTHMHKILKPDLMKNQKYKNIYNNYIKIYPSLKHLSNT